MKVSIVTKVSNRNVIISYKEPQQYYNSLRVSIADTIDNQLK